VNEERDSFEAHRPRLRAIAYRMIGSSGEADDAVQEAWIRYSRADTEGVEDLGRWLSTVLARVCLNLLEARRLRPQPPSALDLPEPSAAPGEEDPEHELLLADSIGRALLVVLDTLTPAERIAFVLHDVFAIPFDQIAPVVDRSVPATRQLASRARSRVHAGAEDEQGDGVRQAALVDAFLVAARQGDFDALISVLDPDVVLRADAAAVALGAAAESRGREEVAGFARFARGGRPAVLDGTAAAAWMPGGELRVVWRFTAGADGIVAIELIADAERLRALDLRTG
jgi:RNA polymerase sigma-70 factor (ECF subfamily)